MGKDDEDEDEEGKQRARCREAVTVQEDQVTRRADS
jgi:hypothetical protein